LPYFHLNITEYTIIFLKIKVFLSFFGPFFRSSKQKSVKKVSRETKPHIFIHGKSAHRKGEHFRLWMWGVKEKDMGAGKPRYIKPFRA